MLAGTPIGNVADASPRLLDLLATADIVAAEDTRKTRDLARRLSVAIGGRLVSCYEHNEQARADELLDAVAAGQTVALVTDAGMPAVSDPGYQLVARAVACGLAVTTAPGPSAVLAALAISGLPSDRFTFEGFLPRKPGDRRRALTALATEPRTMVFFESPHRIEAALADLAATFGDDRPAALCRELTKIHEEVLRGTLGALHDEVARRASDSDGANRLRGEIALVVAGAPSPATPDVAELAALVRERVAAGERLKSAAAVVAAEHGVSKRELYNRCV